MTKGELHERTTGVEQCRNGLEQPWVQHECQGRPVTSGLLGADPERLEQLARTYGVAAKEAERTANAMERGLRNVKWHGDDGEQMRRRMRGLSRRVSTDTVELIRAAATTLTRHASDQRRASATLDGGSGACYPGDGPLRNGRMAPVSPGSLDKKIAAIDEKIKRLEADKANDNWWQRQVDGLGGANPLARSKAETLEDLRRSRKALVDMRKHDRNILKVEVDDNGESLRVIEAYGDLESATRVVIHIPGMNTGPAAYDDLGNSDARRLQKELNRLSAPGEKVVVVSWADYDIPMGGQEAAMSGRAKDGGQGLARFTEQVKGMGIPGDKISVVAHSYGSTTAGFGMQSGMDVGNVIIIGSPGMGVFMRDDLGASDSDVWVGEARRDAVADLAAFGTDPSSSIFGAQSFSTTGSTGHSQYFDESSRSLTNLARLSLDQEPIK